MNVRDLPLLLFLLTLSACMRQMPPRPAPPPMLRIAPLVESQETTQQGWALPQGATLQALPASSAGPASAAGVNQAQTAHYRLTGQDGLVERRADQAHGWLYPDGTVRWGRTPPSRPTPSAAAAETVLQALGLAETPESGPESGFLYLALPPSETAPQGRILELAPPMRGGRADHAAHQYDAALFLQAGDPTRREDHAALLASGPTTEAVWFRRPHVLAAEEEMLWVAAEDGATGRAALFVLPLRGGWRGRPWRCLRAPAGSIITHLSVRTPHGLRIKTRDSAGLEHDWGIEISLD